MEKINGSKLYYKSSIINKILNIFYDKNILYKNLFNSIKNLWVLGYTHNDLHLGNIIINRRFNNKFSIKFIDFESVTKISENNLLNLRKFLEEKENDYLNIIEFYINNIKPDILSLIYLSSYYFELHINNKINQIENSDEQILLILKKYLKIT